MKPNRPLTTPAYGNTAGPLSAWSHFWFQAMDPISLHVLRVLTGLCLIGWLLPLTGHEQSLFGLQGWFDQRSYGDLTELVRGAGPEAPEKPWSVLFLFGNRPDLVTVTFWAAIAVFGLFTLGIAPRITSVLTWIAVASFTANPNIETDADAFLLMLSFYLMLGYLLLGQLSGPGTLLFRLLGPTPRWLQGKLSLSATTPEMSHGANFALRLFQIHFALAIVTMGVTKLQSGEWWAGVALWYPLYPPMETTLAQAREYSGSPRFFLGILSFAAYAVLAWQIGFPFFAWRQGLGRIVLVAGAAIGWLGATFLYQVPLLGPAFFVSCLGYVTGTEWRALFERMAEWLPRRVAVQQTVMPPRSHATATVMDRV